MATTKSQSEAPPLLSPFSSWRCLSAPEVAANPKKTRGYLQLGLHVSHVRADLEPFHDALLDALREAAAEKRLRSRGADLLLFPHVGSVLPSMCLIVCVDNRTVFESETLDFADDVNESVKAYVEERDAKRPEAGWQGPPPTITVNRALSPPSHLFANFPDFNGNAVQTSPWTGFWDVHSPGAQLGFHLVHRAPDPDDGVRDATLASCYVPLKTYLQHVSSAKFPGPPQTLEFSFTVPYVPFAPVVATRPPHQPAKARTRGRSDNAGNEASAEVDAAGTREPTGTSDDITGRESGILRRGSREMRVRFTMSLIHRYASVWLRQLPVTVMHPRTVSFNARLPSSTYVAGWQYVAEGYRRFVASPTVYKMPMHSSREPSAHPFYPLSPVDVVDQALYGQLQDMVDPDVLLAQLRFVYHILVGWYDTVSQYWGMLASWEIPLANILFLTFFMTILIFPRGMFSLPFLLTELVVLMRHYRGSALAEGRPTDAPAAAAEGFEALEAELTALARQWHQKPERVTFQRARADPAQEKGPSDGKETLKRKEEDEEAHSEGSSIAPSAFFVKTLIKKALSPQTTLLFGIVQFSVLPLVIPPLASFHGWLIRHPRPRSLYAKAVKSVRPSLQPQESNGFFVGLRGPPRKSMLAELWASKVTSCVEALFDHNNRVMTVVVVFILTVLSILIPMYCDVIFHLVLLTGAYCITIFLLAFCPPVVPFRRALLTLWASGLVLAGL